MPDAAEIDESEERCGRSAFHVGRAAAVDLLIDQFAAPRRPGPGGLSLDRKDVHVAIEGEMPAGTAAVECGHDVGHQFLRRNNSVIEFVVIENGRDEAGRRGRVARWIWRMATDEFLKKRDQHLAIAI